MELAHVLWIGGGQGSGKSTLARVLSRRVGCRLYNADHRMYAHLARGAETAVAGLSPDEMWLLPSVEELVARMEHSWAERFALVVEDLRASPGEPVVVEGPQLLPRLVAELAAPRRAAFLVVPEAEQRAELAERGGFHLTADPERALANRIERDVRFSARVAQQARELGFPVLLRDAPVDELVRRAETVLDLPASLDAAALARVRRDENEALAQQVALYRASGDAPPEHLDIPLPFACECGKRGCDATVELRLEQFGQSSVHAHAERAS